MTCDFDRHSLGSCADRYRHKGRDQQGNVATCTSNKTLGIFRLASSGKRSSRPIRSPKHMEGQSHLRPVILHHLLIKTNIVLPANLLKRHESVQVTHRLWTIQQVSLLNPQLHCQGNRRNGSARRNVCGRESTLRKSICWRTYYRKQ